MCTFPFVDYNIYLLCCRLSPGCVAGVCESEVADPQLVHGAQGAQTAVNGVTPLHPNQTGCLILFEGLLDICAAQTWEMMKQKHVWRQWGWQLNVSKITSTISPWLLVANMKTSGYFRHIPWTTSICSSVWRTASLYWVSQGTYADQNWQRRGIKGSWMNYQNIYGAAMSL